MDSIKTIGIILIAFGLASCTSTPSNQAAHKHMENLENTNPTVNMHVSDETPFVPSRFW
jgi:uncharacterized OsmC-like protein